MLNDPKHDEYAIPVELLKNARKSMKKGATREQAAAEVVSLLEMCVEKEPSIREHIALLKLNLVQQHIVVEDRLRLVDTNCEESKDYTLLLNRLRSRRHDQHHRRELTEEELVERRKKHNAYMRERRKDPKIRQKLRRGAIKAYHKRKANDPEAHEQYLAEKRQQRKEDLKDPEKVKRYKESAKKYEKTRQERYHTDPKFRDECRARARAQYNARRAKQRRRNKKEP